MRIGSEIQQGHRGHGLALAAVHNHQIVALAYIGDIAPDLEDRARRLPGALCDHRVQEAIRHMGREGRVVGGMCAGPAFIPLDLICGDEASDGIDRIGILVRGPEAGTGHRAEEPGNRGFVETQRRYGLPAAGETHDTGVIYV